MKKILAFLLDALRRFVAGLAALLKALLVSEFRRVLLAVLLWIAVLVIVIAVVVWMAAWVFGSGLAGWGAAAAIGALGFAMVRSRG